MALFFYGDIEKGEKQMSKKTLPRFIGNVQRSLIKHSPSILTGIGIAGMVATAVMVGKATPKAVELLQKQKESPDYIEPESKMEGVANVVKTTWKCYLPAAITGFVSITCLLGANSVHAKRNMVLATAYQLSEKAFSEYKDNTVEVVGEKKAQAIQDKIAQKHIEENPINNNEVIVTGKGNSLCYDSISGRYFTSDIERIRRVENELNRELINDLYVSLNEFYHELGLKPIDERIGDELGWNVDDGLVDIAFSSQLAEDGRPCLVINYNLVPRYNYKMFG